MSSKLFRIGGSDVVGEEESRVKSIIWLIFGLQKYADMQKVKMESARSTGTLRSGSKYRPDMGGGISSAGICGVQVATDKELSRSC